MEKLSKYSTKIIFVIGTYILITIILSVLFTVNLLITSSIPRNRVMENVLDAYAKIESEGLYPNAYNLHYGFYDNWTDTVYLNIIVNQSDDHVLESGVANYFVVRAEDEDPIDALQHAILGEGEKEAYSNFWYGSIFFLKVLLVFFRWGEIRYILYLIASSFQVIIAILLYRKINIKAMTAYLFATTLLCVLINVSNIAATSDIMLMQLGAILGLSFYKRLRPELCKGRYEFFFIVGSLQFFCGTIWAPMYSLGMLTLIMALLDHKYSVSDIKKMQYGAVSVLFWLLGYGIAALIKQGLAFIVLGEQIGMKKMSRWSAGGVRTKILAFLIPLKSFDNRVVKVILLLVVVCLIMLILLKKIKISITAPQAKRRAIFLGVSALFPWIYFGILSSAVGHAFYCQNLLSFIFALTYVLLISLNWSS